MILRYEKKIRRSVHYLVLNNVTIAVNCTHMIGLMVLFVQKPYAVNTSQVSCSSEGPQKLLIFFSLQLKIPKGSGIFPGVCHRKCFMRFFAKVRESDTSFFFYINLEQCCLCYPARPDFGLNPKLSVKILLVCALQFHLYASFDTNTIILSVSTVHSLLQPAMVVARRPQNTCLCEWCLIIKFLMLVLESFG